MTDTHPIISLRDAKAQGLTHYFTGKPCAQGHISPRLTSARCCCECARIWNGRAHSINRLHRWKEARPYRMALLAEARYRHKKRWPDVSFDLTVDDIEWPTHCPALGLELFYERDKDRTRPNTATLDRIDSTQGYVKGNVCVLSRRANMIKQNATAAEVMAVAKYLESLSS